MKRRVYFFAHPISMDREYIGRSAQRIKELLAGRYPGDLIKVISGHKDYSRFFGPGGWEQWQSDVVSRCNATTGKPMYQGFVVIGKHCGKATAGILQLAILKGKETLHFDSDEEALLDVLAVAPEDQDDWQTGYRVVLEEKESPSRGPIQLQLFPGG
jgi:hypothetical protein